MSLAVYGPRLVILILLALAALRPGLSAQTIPNPSFEANAAFTGSGAISTNVPIIGWTASDADRIGLNNPSAAQTTFADNGAVPNGTRVAFLRSQGAPSTLSTTITGLTVGVHYRVQFRVNRRSAAGIPAPTYRLNGAAPVSFATGAAVNANGAFTNPYNTISGIFTATATTAALEIANSSSSDSTLLVDNFTVSAAAPIQVKTTNNDGPGSLRQALVSAAGTSVFNVITFAPVLSGQTIALIDQLSVNDPGGVVIDGSGLAAGIVLNGQSTTERVIEVAIGTPLSLRKLTISGGQVIGFNEQGGGMLNNGTVNLVLCTLRGNTSNLAGGAIANNGHMELFQCTLSENVSVNGGGIMNSNSGTVVLTHCTISGNDSIGGGGIRNFGRVTVAHSIVAGNRAPFGPEIDIQNSGGTVTRVGANLIQFHFSDGGTDTGPAAISGPPELAPLASNGGPTQTMALLPGSPARNAATTSTITSDQRGRGVLGSAPDIGAFEVQRGVFVLSSTGSSIPESAGSAPVTINRIEGFEGSASVNLSTVVGTASAADFTGFTNQVHNFADGVVVSSTGVTILNDAVVEANETFTVTLSAPSAGTTIGSLPSAKITILDPSSSSNVTDTVAPAAPVFITPAINTSLNNRAFVTFSGTASDNKGIASVQIAVDVNGAVPVSFFSTTLSSPGATSTGWTFGSPLFLGPVARTLEVAVKSVDFAGRESSVVRRTFKVLNPLSVQLTGNGSVTPAGFTPQSFREVGQSLTLTATPAAGQMFTHWTLEGATAAQIGVPSVALQRPTLIFLNRPGLRLIANFVPSPYVTNPNITGNYKNLLTASNSVPAGGTPSSNSSEGLLSLTVTSTGAFSGTLVIDGSSLGVSGALDHAGVARFGSSRGTTVRLARGPTKPSLELAFNLLPNGASFFPVMNGSVIARDFRNVITARSDIVGSTRAAFNGTTSVLGGAFVGATGSAVYNVCFRPLPPASQPAGLSENAYPQGTGFGRVTLTKAGIVKLTDCTLADGTTGVTASTFVDSSPTAILFIPLYNKGGFLRTVLTFNPTASGSDVSGQAAGVNPTWARPAGTSHHYHDAWPEVINLSVDGAIYNPVNGTSVLKPANGGALQPPDADGNATLTFTKGQLSETLTKALNFPATDAVAKVPANDATFTFTFRRATGLFSGTFLHSDNTMTSFKGIMHPKAPNSGGFGFFLTTPPVPADFTGESGQVVLLGAP